MITMMGWVVELERCRMSLNSSAQERLAQLAYSQQTAGKPAETMARKKADWAVGMQVRCCPEATA